MPVVILTDMDDRTFARYLGRMQDAKTPAELVAITKELSTLPSSEERDALQRTIRTMMIRRAVEN